MELISKYMGEIMVLIMGATPIVELRGAIPFGILRYNFSPMYSTVISIIGNSLIVPFLLLLLKPIFNYFRHFKYFDKIIVWLEERTRKRSKNVEKYKIFGLFLLVAIPLPTTGAYTGCLAATLFEIEFKHALPAIILGVISAGIIMLTLSSLGIMAIAG